MASYELIADGGIRGAGALYLVHDVNYIIQKGLLPELHIPVAQFFCQSTTGNSRADIKFVVKNKTVLILAYKSAYVFTQFFLFYWSGNVKSPF